jgi:hypothetical protein
MSDTSTEPTIPVWYRFSFWDPSANGVMTATMEGKASDVSDALSRLGKMLEQFPQEHFESASISLTPFLEDEE